MATEIAYKKVMSMASNWVRGLTKSHLDKMGLRYEDLMMSESPVVKEAMDLADPDIVKGRLRRLKRASDLMYKTKEFQDYAPNEHIDTFKQELFEDVKKVQAREDEYNLLDMHKK